MQRLILQAEEKIEVTGKAGEEKEERAASFEESKLLEDFEEATDKEEKDGKEEKEGRFEQRCKIVEKVDAGVQHNGFFETSFEFSPSAEDEQEARVSEVARQE